MAKYAIRYTIDIVIEARSKNTAQTEADWLYNKLDFRDIDHTPYPHAGIVATSKSRLQLIQE